MKVVIIFYLILCRPVMLCSSSSSATTAPLPLCRAVICCDILRSLLLSKKLVIDRCISNVRSRPPLHSLHFCQALHRHLPLARMRRSDTLRLSLVYASVRHENIVETTTPGMQSFQYSTQRRVLTFCISFE